MEEIAWKMGRKYVSENTGGGHPTEPRVPTGCPYKERCSRAKRTSRITFTALKKTHEETSIINTVRFPCVSGASIFRCALIRWAIIY